MVIYLYIYLMGHGHNVLITVYILVTYGRSIDRPNNIDKYENEINKQTILLETLRDNV